jgi:hypothetical protein
MAGHRYGCSRCGALDFVRPGELLLGIVQDGGEPPLGRWRTHEQGNDPEEEAFLVNRYGWRCAKGHDMAPESALALLTGLSGGRLFPYPENLAVGSSGHG